MKKKKLFTIPAVTSSAVYKIELTITEKPDGNTESSCNMDKKLNAVFAANHLRILSEQILELVDKKVKEQAFTDADKIRDYVTELNFGELS